MKIKPNLSTLLFTFIYLNVSANEGKEVVSPSTPFHKALTQLALGNSILCGVIQLKAENPKQTLLGIDGSLFPYTSYFNEWLALSKNNKKGKKIVAISNEALTYPILAKASDEGCTFSLCCL